MRMTTIFPAQYRIEESELPGAGMEVVHFKRSGLTMPEPTDGVILRVTPADANEWFGLFGSGVANGDRFSSGVYTTPSPDIACITVSGAAYWLNVYARTKEDIPVFPVRNVRTVTIFSAILLADFSSICAYGGSGLLWMAKGVGIDQLEIDSVEDNVIHCSSWRPDLGVRVPASLDIRTGKKIA